MTVTDLTQESLALLDMVSSSGGDDPGESFEKMMLLLKKIKDFVQTYNPNLHDVPLRSPKPSLPKAQDEDQKNVPEDFRCPISLKLMSDPVIVSSGQVLLKVITTFVNSVLSESFLFCRLMTVTALRNG